MNSSASANSSVALDRTTGANACWLAERVLTISELLSDKGEMSSAKQIASRALDVFDNALHSAKESQSIFATGREKLEGAHLNLTVYKRRRTARYKHIGVRLQLSGALPVCTDRECTHGANM